MVKSSYNYGKTSLESPYFRPHKPKPRILCATYRLRVPWRDSPITAHVGIYSSWTYNAALASGKQLHTVLALKVESKRGKCNVSPPPHAPVHTRAECFARKVFTQQLTKRVWSKYLRCPLFLSPLSLSFPSCGVWRTFTLSSKPTPS